MYKLQEIEKDYLKSEVTQFSIGDTIKVYVNITEGDKKRVQAVEGVVIAKKNSGCRETFTLRKISSGIGVERIFPLHSPSIEKIQLIRQGKVRRSKLYYLRDRKGKSARIKEKRTR